MVLTLLWREALWRWPTQSARPREKARGTRELNGSRHAVVDAIAARSGHRNRDSRRSNVNTSNARL